MVLYIYIKNQVIIFDLPTRLVLVFIFTGRTFKKILLLLFRSVWHCFLNLNDKYK